MSREAREALLKLENQGGPLPAGRRDGGPQPAQTQEDYDVELANARSAAEDEALAAGEHRTQSPRLEESAEDDASAEGAESESDAPDEEPTEVQAESTDESEDAGESGDSDSEGVAPA